MLETLAARALAAGEATTAAKYLRKAVTADPLRESARRALMRALSAEGDYAAALQVYRELGDRLHRGLHALADQLLVLARDATAVGDGATLDEAARAVEELRSRL